MKTQTLTAKFIGWQVAGDPSHSFPLFNIPVVGGGATTVTTPTLEKQGIPVPFYPTLEDYEYLMAHIGKDVK